MNVSWQRAKNDLRDAGIRILVFVVWVFALLAAPVAASAADNPPMSYVKVSGTARQDSGRYPVDEHDQFDIRNDGSPIWNVLQAAAARRQPDRQSSNPSEDPRKNP